jgi:AhpD family alkylhydroperoxidase
MPNDVFPVKDRALISLAASVASGCRPCTAHHLQSVRAAGACERSVRLALETALTGRASAITAMADWADWCQGSRPEVDHDFRSSKRLVVDLMSVATAVAVNSAPDLELSLATAQRSGATIEQIRATIGIARQIQRVAQEKIEDITNRLEQQAPSIATAAATTVCCGAERTGTAEAAVGTKAGCGCR